MRHGPEGTRLASIVTATNDARPEAGLRDKARQFAADLLIGAKTSVGEDLLMHADGMVNILAEIGGSETIQAAVYLSVASGQLNRPQEIIEQTFGENLAKLAVETARLEKLQQRSRAIRDDFKNDTERSRVQTESVRKMLLAFSRDLRVILLRLTSRLQTLRYTTAKGQAIPDDLLREADEVFAPLANRLGIWQIKWQMEDLIYRAKNPEGYRRIARLLDAKRVERETALERRRGEIQAALAALGISAQVSGRPKHISSIARKMHGKNLDFEHVFDVRALRVIVPTVADCYAVLDWAHRQYDAIAEEFDDYIAKPKINGYQSIHTVVRDGDDRTWEIQIRTQAMHDHAEHGVAAHWAYKEAGAKGYAGVSAAGAYDAKIMVLRQLLAWERDLSGAAAQHGLLDDRIYVLTPDASVVELPSGATPVDFAYSVHTELGHRCRGARVDGAMVPLNTPLKNGQTVEVSTSKEGGPSRDWLNADLGYLVSPRARAKVRAWFNAQHTSETVARGREMVEKLLQREGRTAQSLDQLAGWLGFKSPDALFATVGKDELSLRSIRNVLNPPQESASSDAEVLPTKVAPTPSNRGGVLVVGLDSLLTVPARCCKPAPPDAIAGYVTRGRGVSVHRRDCKSFQALKTRHPERVIDVAWSDDKPGKLPAYPVDVMVEGSDRNGLLRDVSDVFARAKMPVRDVRLRTGVGGAWMTLTISVSDTNQLKQVLRQVREIAGVRAARRR